MDFVDILVFTLIPKAILTLSIYFYDKSRGIEKKATSYVLAFIFGLLYIIGRLITKKGTRTATPDKKFKKISIVLIVVYVLYVIGTNAASYISISNAEHYFDRNGNGYNRWYKVVYYTEDGTGYVIDRNEYMFVEVDAPENKIDTWGGYLDENGYLVFLDPETVDYDESLPWDEPYCFYDSEGNRYALPTTSCWNEKGELVDQSSAYTVENDYLEKIKPFIDKLIENQQSWNNTGSLQPLCA